MSTENYKLKLLPVSDENESNTRVRSNNKKTMLFSRSVGLVDLRLTRPPESLKQPKSSHHEISPGEIASPSRIDEFHENRQKLSTPEKRKREKQATVDDITEKIIKATQKSQDLFADLTPEARKRLHAMLINFCGGENGIFQDEINLRQFSIDCGETITNATVQELCSLQPSIKKLDISNCEFVSDVGLWAIARHCVDLKDLNLTGCLAITNIGLRSISLRCSELLTLNLSNCVKLDDLSLATIAGGCWKLETLILRKCTGVSDTGVGKIARVCIKLKILDLHGCSGVGEFGDHALKELGAFCGYLEELDMIGCRHVQDCGIRAIAVGCQRLKVLKVSGGDGITGNGLRALAKHCRQLQTLALTGCKYLTDNDMPLLYSQPLRDSLTSLDFSGCVKLTDKGIHSLCSTVGVRLFNLNLSESLATDLSSMAISDSCIKLRSLDLRNCKAISDHTVNTIVNHVTGLTILKLDGNHAVTTRAITKHIGPKLEFAELAQDWLGYQPKQNHEKLIFIREDFKKRTSNAIKIQCMLRKKKAYKTYWEKRRFWLVSVVIPKAQARVRGILERRKYAVFKQKKLRNAMATRIQSYIRSYQAFCNYEKMLQSLRKQALITHCAVKLQTTYRCMLARRVVQDIRNDHATKRLLEAKLQAKLQLTAMKLQRNIRAFLGRRVAGRLAAKRLQDRLLLELHTRLTRFLQRMVRGWLGRIRANNKREELAFRRLCWSCALSIQRVFRGVIGRARARLAWKEYWRRLQEAAATDIKRMWRGHKARNLAKMAIALRKLRMQRYRSTMLVQRIYRAYRARQRVTKIRAEQQEIQRNLHAALLIQKIYRGHKAKECLEIERRIVEMESQVRPLTMLLIQLEKDVHDLDIKVRKLTEREAELSKEKEEVERESLHVNNTTMKWTDSSRINGIPQRFLTKFLRVRLLDYVKANKIAHRKAEIDLTHTQSALRETTRKLRSVQRELVPLTTGLIVKVKRERSQRLRNAIRRRKRAAIRIQALWRGAITRTAYKDSTRDCWVECFDEEQGSEKYYYNTWSQETAWVEPPAYRLFGLRNESVLSTSEVATATSLY